MAVYPDGPQGIGRVLDTSFRLYRASVGKATLLALIALFLAFAPSVLYVVVAFRDAGSASAGSGSIVVGVLSFICSIASLAVYLGIFQQIDAVGRGGTDTTLGDAVAMGFKRLLPAIWTAIVWYVAIIGASIPAIVAAVLLSDISPAASGVATAVLALLPVAVVVYLLFAFVLTVTDRESGLKAVRHSYNLVKGNWWRVLLIITVVSVIYMVISGVFAAVGGFLLGLAGGLSGLAGGNLGLMIGAFSGYLLFALFQALFTPYFFAGFLATLHDLKVRKEGGDLEARLSGQA